MGLFLLGACNTRTEGVELKLHMTQQLNSNAPETDIMDVCRECGISANVLTCIKKYKHPPQKLAFDVSTFHMGVCDYCKQEKMITQTRDFFYPDFGLIDQYAKRYGKRTTG